MDWKTDPHLLAKKILNRIEKSDGEVLYSELEQVAKDKDIDLDIFDTAITKLHRFKKVTQKTRGDDIAYKAVPKPKKKTKPAKQCLVKITLKTSPYFGAVVCPLSDFKKEDGVLYRECAILTPKFGTNRAWICPKDIGLPDNDLPLPAQAQSVEKMPFPEIDMSYLMLRPSEMLEFKAQMKGMPVHVMKQLKKHNYER